MLIRSVLNFAGQVYRPALPSFFDRGRGSNSKLTLLSSTKGRLLFDRRSFARRRFLSRCWWFDTPQKEPPFLPPNGWLGGQIKSGVSIPHNCDVDPVGLAQLAPGVTLYEDQLIVFFRSFRLP